MRQQEKMLATALAVALQQIKVAAVIEHEGKRMMFFYDEESSALNLIEVFEGQPGYAPHGTLVSQGARRILRGFESRRSRGGADRVGAVRSPSGRQRDHAEVLRERAG